MGEGTRKKGWKPPKPIDRTPDGRPIFARNAKGQPVCGYPAKTTGKPCQRTQLAENGRCRGRAHGGNAPRGPASGQWKHGQTSRYKEYQALGMAEIIIEASKNLQVTDNTEAILYLEGLWKLEAAGAVPLAPIWEEALSLYQRGAVDPEVSREEKLKALQRLGDVLRDGVDQTTKRNRLIELDRLALPHRKAQMQLELAKGSVMTMMQVFALVDRIAVVVQSKLLSLATEKKVPDKLTAQEIGNELRTASLLPASLSVNLN